MGKMLDTIDKAKGHGGTKHTLAVHLDAMKPSDAADVRAVLADRSYSSRQIARGLTAAGYKISEGAVVNYRQATT